jgi:NADPH2:quinone reductase
VHAEYAAVPAANLVHVPAHVDWETAAAAPLVFGTARRLLIVRGDVTAGESVLVPGASGGIGHAAVQIADYAGAEVYGLGRDADPTDPRDAADERDRPRARTAREPRGFWEGGRNTGP